jgi:hypothetical protein
MNLAIPGRIKTFVGLFASSLDKRKCVVFPLLLTCLLLCRGAKSYAGLSRTIVTYERNRASVSKFFCRQRLNSRNIYEDAMNAVVEQYLEHNRVVKPIVWILAIDGVCSKRGGFAKIDNAIKYRKKRKDTGPTTKAHTFIQGLLITHTGMRIPLPRRTYYTRKYCWKHKKKYMKMTRLAALIIDTVKVPPLVRIVVVADEFFEGTVMDKACNEREFTYIVPIDKRRCCEDQYGKRTAQNLHRHGKSLDRKKLKKIVFKPYRERTALLRRRTGYDNKKRVYFAISEVQRVSGLGERTIVYSWKPRTKSRRWKSNWFKAFVSNAKDCNVATLIEYYELRWQIEIFFRELKSFMGLTDFTGGNFAAYERFVDMVLLAYLFLEWFRVQLLADSQSRKEQATLQTSRTRSLLHVFQGEADAASVDYITVCGKETEALNKLLFSIKRISGKSAAHVND